MDGTYRLCTTFFPVCHWTINKVSPRPLFYWMQMLHFWLFRAMIRPLSSKALPLRLQASCPLSLVLQVSCLGFCYVANTKPENVGLLKKWYVLFRVFFKYVSNQICSMGSSRKETIRLVALKLSQLCIAFRTPCLCGGVLLPLSGLLRFPFIYFF